MYKKEEASQIRQAFWLRFGQYIRPHPSAEGLRANWINYNTKLKNVQFRMQADGKSAYIGIEITHADIEMQELFFDQFLSLKNLLHTILGEEWEWELHHVDVNQKTISRIYKELKPVNIYNEEEWPEIISFLKPRIIALDEFWSDGKYSFSGF